MNATTVEIAFEVAGWPPTKNEAQSLLAAGHSHAPRVRDLLLAAQQAAEASGWQRVDGPVRLEVVIRGPHRPPSDATNYLGGIADVLQDKTNAHLVDLTHLGLLRAVALYTNDRQITQIHYAEDAAAQPSYLVRIRQLDPHTPHRSGQ